MTESSFLNPSKALQAAKVREGMHVADFDAGSGFFTRAAARMVGTTGKVWAVDANRELLTRIKNTAAAEGLHAIELVAGSVEHRGGSHLGDAEMDFVIAANTLFTVTDKNGLVEEMWRVLKAHTLTSEAGRALVIDWKDSYGGLGPHPDHVIEEKAARTLFEQGGFSFAENIPCGQYHWGFVVRKK